MKFLLWLVIIFLVVAWLMRGKKGVNRATTSSRHQNSAPSQVGISEPMVQCVKCGVHIPASESIAHTSGKVFCSEEHRQQSFPS